MAEYNWPDRKAATVIGSRVNRLDGLEKATGAAKYTYDVNLRHQLVALAVGCPHAHCKVLSIDTSAAERVPGVVHVHVIHEPGYEAFWEGDLIAAVAAESEGAAREGALALAAAIKYELLDVYTDEENLTAASVAERSVNGGSRVRTVKEPAEGEDEDAFVDKEINRLLKEAEHVVEGYYGIDTITHCCLEPHGSTVMWDGDNLVAYLSTQNVSGTDEGFATSLGTTSDKVHVICDYIGGGFGSKFAPDYWGTAAAQIAKATGRPVKFMLTRDQELKNGGNRPSGYNKVRIGADKDGVINVWDSQHWGSLGYSARGGTVSASQIPYVFDPPNYRVVQTNIKTNTDRSRAWRAPNHPQACAMSQTAYDDLSRVMGVDSFDIFMRNLKHISSQNPDAQNVYAEEMKIGAELIGWKDKWHPHGKGAANGSVVEGLGMALHTWGGVANSSTCTLKVYPDGGVESFCGSQDLGTGTRTVCAMVLAETLGLKPADVKINIGSSRLPFSGASGGSTTVGAVCESHRRAGQDALEKILALAAKQLETEPGSLEAVEGRIQVKGNAQKSITWQTACSMLGVKPLEVTASHNRGDASALSSSGVCGVQMAHVAVDKDTGVVKMKTFVAVQDQGLVINPKTCESQIYGAAIMGIAYALYERRICDPSTGAFVNAELSDYKLPRLGDVGDIIVHLYDTEKERARGVIGNGEPPVISPGAAISNAVCNALGVRVPVLPITPDRVLKALGKA